MGAARSDPTAQAPSRRVVVAGVLVLYVLRGGDAGVGSRGVGVLAVDDPFAARCPPNRADPHAGLVVQPAAVVDGQGAIYADGRGHDPLRAGGVEVLQAAVVERPAIDSKTRCIAGSACIVTALTPPAS